MKSKKARNFKAHTLGEVRYLTYQLVFPDKDAWVDQQPFVGPVWHFLQNTKLPEQIKIDLQKVGKASHKDQNGVWHNLVIEETKRPRVWGGSKVPSGIVLN